MARGELRFGKAGLCHARSHRLFAANEGCQGEAALFGEAAFSGSSSWFRC
jgi:hypothetical protein